VSPNRAGGFIVWIELPERIDAVKLAQQALAAGISIAPGPIFFGDSEVSKFYSLELRLRME